MAKRIPHSATLRWLAALWIFHDPTAGAIWNGDPRLRERIPPGKSLFGAPPGKGLPIGNHTSQFYANVYLNELDQLVKHRLKAPYYIRYVDDLVLLSPSREELERWREEIGAFVKEHLLLELNERRSRIAPLSSGIDFLGYVTHPRHRLVRRRVVGNLQERLAALEKEVTVEAAGYHWVLYREGASAHLEAMLASYGAILKRANTRRLRRSREARFPWLERLYPLPSGKSFRRGQRSFASFAAQAHAFRERFRGSLVAIEVGRFFEVHGRDAEALGRLLRLKVYPGRRGGACRSTRFPAGRLSWFLDRAFTSEIQNIVLVGEADEGVGRILPRRAVACGARGARTAGTWKRNAG